MRIVPKYHDEMITTKKKEPDENSPKNFDKSKQCLYKFYISYDLINMKIDSYI